VGRHERLSWIEQVQSGHTRAEERLGLDKTERREEKRRGELDNTRLVIAVEVATNGVP